MIDEMISGLDPRARARVAALLNGEVDVVLSAPPERLERLRRSSAAPVVEKQRNRLKSLPFDHSHRLREWDSGVLRLAVAHPAFIDGPALSWPGA